MGLIEEFKYETLFVVIAIILAYGLYTTIGLALGTSVPIVAVTSGSMEPELQRGDLIIVEGKPFDTIERGDIIIFQSEYMTVPIIHRVIERTDSTLETKGDNNVNQVQFCVSSASSSCSGRIMQTDEGLVCVQPSSGSCQRGELVNVERGITEENVLGTAFFVIPEVGQLKLIPTCFYLQLTGQIGPNSAVC